MRRKIQTHFANETVGSSEPAKVIGRARCPARRTGAILVNPPGMQPHAHTHTRHVRKRRLLRRKLRRRHRVRERAHTAGGKFSGRLCGVVAEPEMTMHIEQGWGHRASFLAKVHPALKLLLRGSPASRFVGPSESPGRPPATARRDNPTGRPTTRADRKINPLQKAPSGATPISAQRAGQPPAGQSHAAMLRAPALSRTAPSRRSSGRKSAA